MPDLMQLLAIPVIKGVRNSAGKYGGMCTWEFSQCLDPVSAIIKGDKVAADGICEMLSAKWVDLHAHGDALPNWVTTGAGKIDKSKIRALMQVFIIGMTMNPTAMVGAPRKGVSEDQTKATRTWLEARGFVVRRIMTPWGRRSTAVENFKTVQRGSATRGDFTTQMGRDLAENLKQGTGSYRMIGIWGPGGAHAMAAWVAQDVAFFDPNFGEFWFERRSDFVKWWPNFMDKSFYRNPKMGMSDKYEIIDYALRVGK